jgi:hypothetical protein
VFGILGVGILGVVILALFDMVLMLIFINLWVFQMCMEGGGGRENRREFKGNGGWGLGKVCVNVLCLMSNLQCDSPFHHRDTSNRKKIIRVNIFYWTKLHVRILCVCR